MHIRHSNLYRMSCLFALESFAFDNVRLCSTCLVKAQY
jgi:hypothetical protein